MTPRVKAVLWGLRIYGPLSIRDLAAKLGRDREQVYRTVYELRDAGLAARLGEASYDVTDAGRDRLAEPPPRPPEPAEKQLVMFPED